MGSGVSGLYYGTYGAAAAANGAANGEAPSSSSGSGDSQRYAPQYSVVEKMRERDRKSNAIWSDEAGYYKNPSAANLEECVSGNSIVYKGVKANGKMTYVVDLEGNLIFGKRVNPINPRARSPHPMLIGGKDPQVRMAGMIEFRGGKIYAIDNDSGHYRPPGKSLEAAEEALSRLPKEVFHKSSKWRSL